MSNVWNELWPELWEEARWLCRNGIKLERKYRCPNCGRLSQFILEGDYAICRRCGARTLQPISLEDEEEESCR